MGVSMGSYRGKNMQKGRGALRPSLQLDDNRSQYVVTDDKD